MVEEIIEYVLVVIASVGGSGLIIIGVSRWIGGIWADRMLESVQHQHQREIEQNRHQFQRDIEQMRHELAILQSSSDRYFGKQFELYSILWHSLYDLKSKADSLWNRADKSTLLPFVDQLKITSDEVEKSYLFLEDGHYISLKNLIEEFKNFEIGKKRLIELRKKDDINLDAINNLVEGNRTKRSNYNNLINNIKQDLKSQLRSGNFHS